MEKIFQNENKQINAHEEEISFNNYAGALLGRNGALVALFDTYKVGSVWQNCLQYEFG